MVLSHEKDLTERNNAPDKQGFQSLARNSNSILKL